MKNRDLKELAQAHCSCRRRVGYQNVVQLATSRDNGQVPKATREYRKGGGGRDVELDLPPLATEFA